MTHDAVLADLIVAARRSLAPSGPKHVYCRLKRGALTSWRLLDGGSGAVIDQCDGTSAEVQAYVAARHPVSETMAAWLA